MNVKNKKLIFLTVNMFVKPKFLIFKDFLNGFSINLNDKNEIIKEKIIEKKQQSNPTKKILEKKITGKCHKYKE